MKFIPLEIEDTTEQQETIGLYNHHHEEEEEEENSKKGGINNIGTTGCIHKSLVFIDNPTAPPKCNDTMTSPIEDHADGEVASKSTSIFSSQSASSYHHNKHIHLTSSLIFLIFMTFSSTLAFTLQLYIIHLTLGLTMRMYFCFPIIFFQTIEHLFVLIVTRRFLDHSKQYYQKGNHEHSYSTIQQYDTHKICVTQTIMMEEEKEHHKPFFYIHDENKIRWCNVIRIVLEMITSAFLSISYFYIVPKVTNILKSLFEDIDGEISSDWYEENKDLQRLVFISKTVGILYLLVISSALLALRLARRKSNNDIVNIEDFQSNNGNAIVGEIDSDGDEQEQRGTEIYYLISTTYADKIINICQVISTTLFTITFLMLLFSISSAWTFLINYKIQPSPGKHNVGINCDPIDTTECMLPFPSSFFTVEDETTITGRRVNIELDAMRSMYKGYKIPKHPIVLNVMDGFSTSGPMLFYLDGLKEGIGNGNKSLVGYDEIELSVTNQSMTLLFDIDSKVLVPHFAEIDYLNEELPLVIVQPAQGLECNRRYAVALTGATDQFGEMLPPSNHLTLLLHDDKNLSTKEKKRSFFYRTEVLPSLYAASFLERSEPIQLLFDFHTMSSETQQGKSKKIINATLVNLNSKDWSWNNSNVRSINVIDQDCSIDGEVTGRIIHGSIVLPHFLTESNTRFGVLDTQAIENGIPNGLSTVKFLITIPCSLTTESKPLRAIIDYGHGFLGSRIEIIARQKNFLQRMSHEQGYVFMASNWRGMSIFDLPIIVKAFAGDPNILVNIQDNIIQGYAFKAGLAHFCKHELLNMNFMKFNKATSSHNTPRMIFYGISQGGILGSAYSTLMGNSNLLDGAAIVSAGTPFAAIMSRSAIFPNYQELMLLNLIQNRHVRIFISMLQMIYDCVEAGGALMSTKVEDRIPTLLQSGIGDSTVTNIASQILARSFNAYIYPNNPHSFGLQVLSKDKNNIKPKSVFTQILFEEEAKSLPTNNLNSGFNPVHICSRSDPYAVQQLTEFINTGEFINVCPHEGCIRKSTWERWNYNYCL